MRWRNKLTSEDRCLLCKEEYENNKSNKQIELPVISKLSVSVHAGEIVAVVGWCHLEIPINKNLYAKFMLE